MKSIKEKAEENCIKYGNLGNVAYQEFVAGANYVLEEIENFMKGLDLGNSTEEKFYKLDVLADIGLFIEQLKK